MPRTTLRYAKPLSTYAEARAEYDKNTTHNNGYFRRIGDDVVEYVLHQTAIITWRLDGSIVLRMRNSHNIGGKRFDTRTTRARINTLTPFYLARVNGVTCVNIGWYGDSAEWIPFHDEMTIKPRAPWNGVPHEIQPA
jgi:hypothetical protein